MPFDEIDEKVPAREKPKLRVRLLLRKSTPRPAFVVTMVVPLMTRLRWDDKDMLALAVGTGTDAGKIMISSPGKGITPLNKLAFACRADFGFVKQLGMRQGAGVPAEFVVLDNPDKGAKAKHRLIVTLPNPWPETSDDAEDEDEQTEVDVDAPANRPAAPLSRSRTAEQNSKPAPSLSGARAAVNAERPPVRRDGVEVRFDSLPPIISCKDGRGGERELELSEVEALMLSPLVMNLNSAMDGSKLAGPIKESGKSLATAMAVVANKLPSLQQRMPKVGLKLTHTKGIGWTLAKLP